MEDLAGFFALARFHLHVGARLAMRAAAPLAAVPVVGILVQQDPSAALRGTAAWVAGPHGGPGAGLAVAAVALTLAAWATPRVTAGLAGWPRHLPVRATTHRRAALVAVAAAQAPLAFALVSMAAFAARQPAGVGLGRLAALPLVTLAAALAAWPGERAWHSRTLALGALVALSQPRLGTLLGAALVLVAAERLAGPLRSSSASGRRSFSPAVPTPTLVAARALGPALVTAPLLGLLPVGAMTLLRVNNDLTPAVAAGAARLGGGLAVVLVIASLAEHLARRRPAWPWARSLPAGSHRRTAEDATALALPCLVPLVATAILEPVAALTVAACLPTLALRAAGAVRASGRPKTGSIGSFLAEAALLAAWVAVLPWLSLPALAVAPFAWRAAAARDRLQKVSRWEELHHRAVGDPQSWSAR